jgi:hypothetical protein
MYIKQDSGLLMLRGFRSGISIWTENLKRYEKDMEGFLNKKLKQFECCDPSIISDYEQYHEEYIELKDEFPLIFRSSLFITCYSFFEFELSIMCKTFFKRYPRKPTFKSYKNNRNRTSSIELIIDYFNNIYMINLKDNSKYFSDIIIYNKLRNNILHNAGRLVQNYDEITNFINSNNNKSKINVNNYGLIIFTKEFVKDVICVVNSFFEEFFGELATWIRSQAK